MSKSRRPSDSRPSSKLKIECSLHRSLPPPSSLSAICSKHWTAGMIYCHVWVGLAVLFMPALTSCFVKISPVHRDLFSHLSSGKQDDDRQEMLPGNQDFWARQKELAKEMSESADRSIKLEMREKFARRRLALVSDSAYFTVLIFCALWATSTNPFTSISYVLGAALGIAYSYGLGKYVETIGGSAEDAGDMQGAGVGQARFAFLILLFVAVGRFRGAGLQELPAILGFFTYQLASLSQGLREIDD